MTFKCVEFPNKEFTSKREMFTALLANKQSIIDRKKEAVKFTDPVSIYVKSLLADKAEGDMEVVSVGSTVYPVINSCWIFDSHGDVHADGIWDKSAEEVNGQIFYIINHDLEIGKVISYPNEVEVMVKTVSWKEIGFDMDGETQVLMFGAKLTDASNKDALNAIIGKKPIQNSVRMRYISLTLCIDDSSSDFMQEKANFDKYISRIANKKDAEEAGFFWLITEAAVWKEGSAVLFGSNHVTPILYSAPEKGENNKDIFDSPRGGQKLKRSSLLT